MQPVTSSHNSISCYGDYTHLVIQNTVTIDIISIALLELTCPLNSGRYLQSAINKLCFADQSVLFWSVSQDKFHFFYMWGEAEAMAPLLKINFKNLGK